MEISIKVYDIYDKLPKQDQWTIGTQMIRAAISIASNIAEGSSRSSEKDYKRFIEIALGSAFELQTQLLIIKALSKTEPNSTEALLTLLTRESKMLLAFSRILKV